jgi:hypothetical protein
LGPFNLEFVRKFAEIFATLCITPAMKHLQQNQFSCTSHSENKVKNHYLSVNSNPTASQENMKKLHISNYSEDM